MAYFLSLPPLYCIITHLHTGAFAGSVAFILGNFILAQDLVGAKYDWHEILALMFLLLSFSGSRQCFYFGIGSFSFTEGTPLFLNLFLFFFNLFLYLWRIDRRLHAIKPNMLSWNVLEPWPYLALLRDFKQRALVSLVLFFESVGVRWLVLRCSCSCLLGVNALLICFHLFGPCRVNCRVPFCLLIIFFILLDPIQYNALPGYLFFFILLNLILCLIISFSISSILPSHFFIILLSLIFCLVILYLLNSILCLVTCFQFPPFDTLPSLFFHPPQFA